MQGTFHRLYEVRDAKGERLLRISALSGKYDVLCMALEARTMGQLRASGIPIPSCEFREIDDDGIFRGAHLIQRAPGICLTELDHDERRMNAALADVGRFLARLHHVKGWHWGPVSLAAPGDHNVDFVGIHQRWTDHVLLRLDEHVELCVRRGAVSPAEAQEIGDCVERFRAVLILDQAPAFLHGDPGSHNFMVDDVSVCAAIDWEDALLGDPIFDVASLCTFHPERRHAAIWAGYGGAPIVGDDTWLRFWLYFLRISLAKTVHRFRFSYPDPPDRVPPSQRIQLALNRLNSR